MVHISRIFPSQVPLSSSTLAVLHLIIRITATSCQLVITVLQRLFWVLSILFWNSLCSYACYIQLNFMPYYFSFDIVGLGWTYPCDMWSIGCILVELCSVSKLAFVSNMLDCDSVTWIAFLVLSCIYDDLLVLIFFQHLVVLYHVIDSTQSWCFTKYSSYVNF